MRLENVLEYLENSAKKYPEKKAVDDGTDSYTYLELMDQAKKIGTALASKSDAGKPVLIFMEKSAACLAALLGTIYAGCFYVVVHPGFPEERICKMLEVMDANVAITETDEEKLSNCDFHGTILQIEKMKSMHISEESLDTIRENSKETDLVYGMFTSGSTGIPKMVVVSHRAVIDFIEDLLGISGISEADIIGNQAPFDFDVSVKDIFSSLAMGSTLVLIAKELFSQPAPLAEFLGRKRVSVLIWAVTALCMLSGTKDKNTVLPQTIRKVMFSGEVMPRKPLEYWMNALPDAEFYNLYGPTEVTCNCTWYKIPKNIKNIGKIPIGSAFPKRKVYLCDDEKRFIHQPQQTGEICVGGQTLASGYYHNEEAQNQKFIWKDYGGGNKEQIYCTGDLGYYDEAGLLYFAGRKDFQIKRMGHRIEMEEVELEIGNTLGVDRACCIYDDEAQFLLAFYTGNAEVTNVRREIRKKLPVYMLPNRIIHVEKFNLTKNGKVDRKYLYELGAKYIKKR